MIPVATAVAETPTYDDENLNESLIAPVETAVLSTATTTATPNLEVIAPATLAEGYSFPVKMGDREFTVTVPKGGVEAGQRFTVPFPGTDNAVESLIQPRINVPVGDWRDGFFSCFTHGLCHPMLCNSIFCPTIANAQVMTRLKLNWYGKPAKNEAEAQKTFILVLYIVIGFFILDRFLLFLEITFLDDVGSYDYEEESLTIPSIIFASMRNIIELLYFVYHVYAMTMTRKYLRSKYAIPTSNQCCGGGEDLCCSVFCHTLTVSQMARHTTDYNTYHSSCCSKTGLPDHIPAIL